MRKWLVASLIVLLFKPTTASAHVIWAGGGSFWAGFLHPLTSVDQVCFLLALGIWLMFNKRYARLWTLVVIVAVSILAAATSWWSDREFSTLTGMTTLMIIAGLGGAARLRIHSAILVAFAAAGACLIGAETSKAIGALSPGAFIVGASLSPFVLLAYVFGGLEWLKAEWQGIACRAIASWIAAVGIMMLTFQLWHPNVQVQTQQGTFR